MICLSLSLFDCGLQLICRYLWNSSRLFGIAVVHVCVVAVVIIIHFLIPLQSCDEKVHYSSWFALGVTCSLGGLCEPVTACSQSLACAMRVSLCTTLSFFFLRSWRKCASGSVSKRGDYTSYWWSRTTSAEEGASAASLERGQRKRSCCCTRKQCRRSPLAHPAPLRQPVEKSGPPDPPATHFTRNHHQTRPSVSLGKFGIGALIPCAELGPLQLHP